jgi:hypothetical protein
MADGIPLLQPRAAVCKNSHKLPGFIDDFAEPPET